MPLPGRLQGLGDEHVEVAGGPELVRHALQLAPDRVALPVRHGVLEQRDRRPEAAQAHPHLVDGVRVPFAPRRTASFATAWRRQERAMAWKAAAARQSPIEPERLRLGRLRPLAGEQVVAALRLGLEAQAQRGRLRERPGDAEQGGRIAALQLQLDLRHRASRPPAPARGGDAAAVEGDLERRAVALHRHRRPLDLDREAGPDRRPHARVREERLQRRAGRGREVELAVGDGVVPLAAVEREAGPPRRLDRLDGAVPPLRMRSEIPAALRARSSVSK